VNSLHRLLTCGALVALVSGCAAIPTLNGNGGDTKSSDAFHNPLVCGIAGALIAGGVGSIENKEAAAVGALAGGALGWWACRTEEKPLEDTDGDGVGDKIDMCPDTPKGTTVGANGCAVDGDTDGDGVPNSADKCPATLAGTKVDADGCDTSRDSDGDGVPDTADLCPSTPPGAPVEKNGCELDTDADGVPDSRDRCAGTAKGVAVGDDGCPADSDGDGVVDRLDRCPNTRAGTRVGPDGCEAAASRAEAAPLAPEQIESDVAPKRPMTATAPIAPESMQSGDAMVLKGVNFESASAKLLPESMAVLDGVAEALKMRSSGAKLEVAGHTDNTGSAALNRALSTRRAVAVRAYLVSKGVPASMLTAKGYGPDAPIGDNGTNDGKAANRRVELKATR
jgi:outer membrane protein OmpA-like peptidoglycan-associated protein